uniref:Uncharacterized protein n=1 Tax=Arundo donax TaxID=35708 RepID=A0A0A8YKW0_ARUDO
MALFPSCMEQDQCLNLIAPGPYPFILLLLPSSPVARALEVRTQNAGCDSDSRAGTRALGE